MKNKEKKKGEFKNLKEFSKYEKIYDTDEIVLFNSYRINDENEVEREKGIMSNLYGGCKIPYDGKVFNSSEQLLFYINFKKWGKFVASSEMDLTNRIDTLMSCKSGKLVKNNKPCTYFLSAIENRTKKLMGLEKALFDDWRNLYFCAMMKYKYCEEFRDVLEKYKDKIYCEDSFWGNNFCGVMYDEELGKYRGINALGRSMKLIYNDRDNIMKGQ